jgi:CheY-like chemotaxis protein
MPKIILIVEDYEDSRQMMRFILESCGYLVLEAEDGEVACQTVKKLHPDLVLMDMSMPRMDGLTATKLIRKEGMTDLPIIAVTAHGKIFYNKAIEAGCNDLIDKPIDFGSLEAVLSKYLER